MNKFVKPFRSYQGAHLYIHIYIYICKYTDRRHSKNYFFTGQNLDIEFFMITILPHMRNMYEKLKYRFKDNYTYLVIPTDLGYVTLETKSIFSPYSIVGR
jgi:hypothetical protein